MIGRPLNTMSNSVCPLIAKTALGPILILSLIVYTNTLCNLIALSRNYTSPAYNRTNAGRRDGASTDTNCLIVNVVHWSRPVDAPSPPLPGLSARSFHWQPALLQVYARTRWLELIQHYEDYTAPEKRVIEISFFLADIAISIVFDCGQNNRFSIMIRWSTQHYMLRYLY